MTTPRIPGSTINGASHEPSRLPPKRKGFPIVPIIAVAVVAGGGFAAWHFLHGGDAAPPASAAASGPVPVGVQTLVAQKQRIWSVFSGRLKAVDSADIRPEVSGRITELRFKDGQSVQAGDVLLVIDPRPFEAAVARAEARITSAKGTLLFTAPEKARDATLLQSKAISQREYDQANSADIAAAGELQAAEADLKTSQVDLDHAYVKAPISGRVSRAELTVGNLVQSGPGAPLLTSIVSEDGIYADFEVDEQTYLDTIRAAANGNAQEQTIPVDLVVEGESDRVYHGFIQNFDNKLDSASGTIRARARFDNADRTLVPGMFVSARLAGGKEESLVVVSDLAISFDQSKSTVLVVGPDNKVAYREVELGAALLGGHVVTKGLQDGEKVIVDGLQRVRPGSLVTPKEYEFPKPATPASAATPTAVVKQD